MGLAAIIAGRYTATHNANSLGITRQGYKLSFSTKDELVDETDAYGLTVIDAITRGMDCSLDFIAREYGAAGILGAMWPNGGGTFGILQNAANPIGRLATDHANAVVLTATASTPAAASPATLTASECKISEGFNVDLIFDSRARDVPIRFRLFPYLSTNVIFFSTT